MYRLPNIISDKINEVEVGRACGTTGMQEIYICIYIYIGFGLENLKRRVSLENLGSYGRISELQRTGWESVD
jgi:hypothetical protein